MLAAAESRADGRADLDSDGVLRGQPALDA